MNADPARLARQLGHEFARSDRLTQALTHRSAGAANNERLEFLGDALIGFVIADALQERFPGADEGTLSRMRAALVKSESLAGLARELRLGDYLRLGSGELRTGGHGRESILADAMEAVFGAVYLDGGFDAARRVVLDRFGPALELTGQSGAGKDPKTRLQEFLQAHQRPLPEYDIVTIDGDAHDQTFTVTCRLADSDFSSRGLGTSRRRAEQAAAAAMLERLAS